MSWSVSAKGSPAKVKEYLAGQFEQAKKSTAHIPHESETVALAADIINKQLDFAAEYGIALVDVAANGSAWVSNTPDYYGAKGNAALNIKFEPIYGVML